MDDGVPGRTLGINMIATDSSGYSRLLSEVLPKGSPLPSYRDRTINGLCLDSRNIRPGELFLACKGLTVDGRKFISQALMGGAVAVIAEKGLDQSAFINSSQENGDESVPIIEVKNLNQQLGFIASRYFGNPSEKLKVIGITGTNGKTTTAHLLSDVLRREAGACGVIGTLGMVTLGPGDIEKTSDTGFTTPDAVVLQSQLFEWANAGIEWVVVEVSSHGLDLGRLNGTQFYAAVLTNVTRDHLDYHGSFEAYKTAKQTLFEWPTLELGVLNCDDNSCQQFRDSMQSGVSQHTYGFGSECDYQMNGLTLSSTGLSFKLRVPKNAISDSEIEELTIDSPLFGKFNAYNLAATTTVLLGLGFEAKFLQGLNVAQGPLGRMQHIQADGNSDGGNPTVIVDYAHTPDALENILTAVRAHSQKKVWCVFGCGGDRDTGKRSIMGEVAERLSDNVIVTDDNPRSEKSESIIADITKGMTLGSFRIISDRAAAIDAAISEANAGDIVVLAGKGHESYQETKGLKTAFSDVEQAKLSLNARGLTISKRDSEC